MTKISSQWKVLERDTAKALKGRRISRGYDFGQTDIDVYIEDFPYFKVDSKRRKKSQVFTLFDEVKRKYCGSPKDEPILVIREWNRKYELAVIDLELLGRFLDFIRQKKGQREFNN
jgi:hypothetical protein